MLSRRSFLGSAAAIAGNGSAATGVIAKASAEVVPWLTATIAGRQALFYETLDKSRILTASPNTPFHEIIDTVGRYNLHFQNASINGPAELHNWKSIFLFMVSGDKQFKLPELGGLAHVKLADVTEHTLLSAAQMSVDYGWKRHDDKNLPEYMEQVHSLIRLDLRTIGDVNVSFARKMLTFLPDLLSQFENNSDIFLQSKPDTARELSEILDHCTTIYPNLTEDLQNSRRLVAPYEERLKLEVQRDNEEKLAELARNRPHLFTNKPPDYTVNHKFDKESDWKNFTIRTGKNVPIPTRVDFQRLRWSLCIPEGAKSEGYRKAIEENPYRPADIRVEYESEAKISISTRDPLLKEHLAECMQGNKELVFPKCRLA